MSKIYEVPEAKLKPLLARAQKVALRAERHGMPVPSIKLIGTSTRTIEVFDPLAKVRGHEDSKRRIGFVMATVEVDGCEPRVGDWNVIGYRYQVRQHNNEVLSYDSGEVEPHRHGTPLCCEHCNTKRNRRETLIVCNETREKVVEVGSTCLGDFVGLHFNEGFLNSVRDAGMLLGEIEKASNWSFDDPELDLQEEVRSVLAVAASIVREQGFTSFQQAERTGTQSTSSLVAAEVHRLNNPNIDQSTVMVLETDFDFADRIIQFFKSSTEENAFFHAVRGCLDRGLVAQRDIGLLAAAAGTYDRILEQEKKKDRAKGVIDNSSHVGTINKGLTFTAAVKDKRYVRNSDFWVVTFIDRSDNLFTWLTNNEPEMEVGQRYEFKATVKSHHEERYGDYRGAQVTQIKNVRVKERLGPEVTAPEPVISSALNDELDMALGI